MGLCVLVNLLHILVKLHILAVIIDNQLIQIRNDLLYLLHGQQEAVSGQKDKALRQLLPTVFVKFQNSRIQIGLVIPVQCQVALVAPVMKLVDNAVKQTFLHTLVGTLLRILVCRAEGTGTVAAVYGLKVHHKRLRDLLPLQKILYILLLKLISGQKL